MEDIVIVVFNHGKPIIAESLQEANDMKNINIYKRALNDFKTSIESIYEESDDAYEMADDLENFVLTEMKELLDDLNLD